jgi:peptidoglycan/LPS O-acetylase OafA/YrhL
MHPTVIDTARRPRLMASAVLWLIAGVVLLSTTLVPAHTEFFGWTPMFWLLGAPLAVLLTLEPRLPRQLLRLRQSRRRTSSRLIWH